MANPGRAQVASPKASPSKLARRRPLCFGLVLGAASAFSGSASKASIEQGVDSSGVITLSSKPSKGSAKRAFLPVSMPRDASPERYSRYQAYVAEASALYQIPEPLILAVIKVESDFDPRAVSPANAHGLMQLIPPTAERMLVTDVFEPRQNILGGTRYLRILANLFNGDLQLTLAAYNAGEGAVMRHGGIPPYRETVGYVEKVIQFYQQYQAAHPAR